MVDCQSSSYQIDKTDSNTDSILLLKGQIDQDSLDITLLGKRRREYGEVFNENLLHLLENFAAPQDLSTSNITPDFSATVNNLLENPTTGQLWFNTTDERIYHYTGSEWRQLSQVGDVAGNYGTIVTGEQLPRPVSPVTGYVFPYSECSWVVSPSGYNSNIDWMQCLTDDNANVTFEFRKIGSSNLTAGVANYQIIGIKTNSSIGQQTPPTLPT